MRLFNTFVNSFLLLLFPSVFAQLPNDSIKYLEIKKSITEHLNTEQKRIQTPKINGYDIQLIGSDNQTIIDLKGQIHQPLVNKKVNLLYKATRLNDNVVTEIPINNILIKGKYASAGTNSKPFVIPSLREWYGLEGNFKLSHKSRIILPTNDDLLIQVAQLLKDDLKKQIGLDLEIKINSKTKEGDILIENSKEIQLGSEGYKLDIDKIIHISAPSYSGKVFATRTILQLLEQSTSDFTLPKGLIRDYPTYAERALMLDVGRKYITIDFLNDYVELLSYYKISNFQIHLNDNAFHKYFNFNWDETPSGFRLENSTYPNLASKDGHYTKKEFIDLQKKAIKYGIKIIPEIDVPAHSLSISKIIPEIGSDKYGKDHLDLNNPKTYEVVQNIFEEYIQGENPVFIGKEVHIGTDEYDKKEAESFRKFTDFLIKVVQKNGKDVRAWGALTHAKGTTPVTANNVTLNMWYNGYADPLEMKKLGYKQISTPDGWLYIVPAAGYYYDYLNTDNIYNKWEPRHVGNITFEKGDPTIIGGMFAIWNDIAGNGISQKDIHNRAFPAIQTLAEKMWSADDEKISLFDFNQKKKLINEGPGLNIRGIYGNAPQLILHLPFDQDLKDSQSFFKEGIKSNHQNFAKGKINEALITHEQNTLELPLEEIGQNYTISFWMNLNQDSEIQFNSKNANVNISKNGIEFSREKYHYTLIDKLDLNTWTFVTITGNTSETNLYLNGKLVTNLTTEKIVLPYKDKSENEVFFNKVKTLTFPLREMKLKQITIDDFKIYNTTLNKNEILNEYQNLMN